MSSPGSSPTYSVSCPCGVVIQGTTFDDLFTRVNDHASADHEMAMSHEQVRDMMSTDAM